MRVSAVIPAYNEEPRIGSVLSAACACDDVEEIIVVDDGSFDNTAEVAKQYTRKVIVNKENLGKTPSMVKGALAAKNDIIVFLDADLIGLKPYHISKLIRPVIQERADISVSYLRGNPFFNRFIILTQPSFTGQRCMRKDDFFAIENLYSAGGYEFEIMCNNHFLENNMRIAVVPIEAFDQFKYKKTNFFDGWQNDLKQTRDLLFGFGFDGIKPVWDISVRFQFKRLRSRNDTIIL